jgi:uncharacterized protein (TIGR02300 family)
VAKPELGTKRLCGNCGAKFYDLSKTPIVCPKCETVFTVVVPITRGRPGAAEAAAAAATAAAATAAAAAAAAAPKEEIEAETADAEFVSLEDADAEASGKKGEGDDDIEIEETPDDAPFIEEQEEGDEDVTDIIGEGREDEEET